MDSYEKILADVANQTQQQDSAQGNKIYRYSGLIHAIEFFSQRFSLENILQHIFDFTNELIISDQVALLIRDERSNDLHPVFDKGYGEHPLLLGNDIDRIVYFHAGILDRQTLANYFNEEALEYYNPDMAIQLIMNKSLFGLVFLKRERQQYSLDDQIIANALMNLFSTSLTNFSAYDDLEKAKKSLDEKIFNLFAINQSTKALLSELDEEKLIELSVSVYSELTQSSMTGIFLFDDASENYKLLKALDVYSPGNFKQIILYPNRDMPFDSQLSVVNCNNEDQVKAFMAYFQNKFSVLEPLKPTHIINISNEGKLLGFVTLSDKVNGGTYKESEFELMESIVASTFIAINNAKFLKEIKYQKDIINGKLNELNRLNSLMKNINTAVDVESLIDLTMRTLNVAFGFDRIAFGLLEKEGEDVSYQLHTQRFGLLEHKVPHVTQIDDLLRGDTQMIYYSEEVLKILKAMDLEFDEDYCQGLLMVPVTTNFNDELKVMGFVAALSVKEGLLFDEIHVATMESIVTHVGPVLHQLHKAQMLEKQYEINELEAFMTKVTSEIQEGIEYYLDMTVAHGTVNGFHITEPLGDKLKMNPAWRTKKKCFIIDRQNVLFILSDAEAKQLTTDNPEVTVRSYRLHDDFKDLDELIALLEK